MIVISGWIFLTRRYLGGSILRRTPSGYHALESGKYTSNGCDVCSDKLYEIEMRNYRRQSGRLRRASASARTAARGLPTWQWLMEDPDEVDGQLTSLYEIPPVRQ